MNNNLHRNSQKRFYDEDYIYFVVTKTFNNFPYFKEKIFCDLFVKELEFCKKLKKFQLYGFCLVYDHLNLLIQPGKEFNISKVMKSLKENVSRDINYIVDNQHYEGDTSTCRLQLRDFIINCQNEFIKKYGPHQTIFPKFQWQKSYHDHVIRNERDFLSHEKYTVYNFQKHELPDDWQYTSLNYPDLVDSIIV